MNTTKRLFAAMMLLITTCLAALADDIKGIVVDKQTGEALIGATVMVGEKGCATDINGQFELKGLKKGNQTVIIKYVGYKTLTLKVSVSGSPAAEPVKIEMESDQQVLGEVIRRVPGVSLIEDKFVMVRGLSQRYNNVWINGGAVPSSEADSRAFSFDIIPSSQIDNLVIVKSPSAEYPSDFTGGFIQINTKDIPSQNTFSVSVGGNWNDATDFKDFRYANLSSDYIKDGAVSILGSGLNNDWRVKSRKPIGDLKLGADWSRRWTIGESKLGMVGAVNYTNETRSFTDMQNNLFGVYDSANDRSNYLRRSTDDQYNNNSRLGAMLNLALLSKSGNNKYELKNIFNRLVNERYTDRTGIDAQSNNEIGAEYYYRSRITYNTQLTGKHTFTDDHVEWSASYSYANRRMPDRKRYTINDQNDDVIQLTSSNDINREFTKLDEHIMSANINEKHDFHFGSFEPSLRIGAYGEYRTREYKTRQFLYTWDPQNNDLPEGFRRMDMTELLSNEQYLGGNGLNILEDLVMRNNYKGHNTLGAGYLAASIPVGKLNIYAGVRYEFNQMELITNSRDDVESPKSKFYRNRDFFPSVNTVYKFDDKHQVRLAYGKSVNRPEFREVSPSVYYDFDLASNVQGKVDLKSCYIHNVDLRYEFYPSRGEQITIAGFYKHFSNPIEWTYTVAGGTDLVYSYENAESADNFGVELDIRKDLSFIGLRNFSLSFNGTLIHSRVNFPAGSRYENRPMQGQSPYLVNTGLFYKNDKQQLSLSLLYNRIGKRIIGVGRSEGSTGSEDNARVPDSYEMPRDVLDFTISKKFGSHWEIKANIRDILAQKVSYKQFAEAKNADGSTREVVQITRQYKPGRNIGITAVATF